MSDISRELDAIVSERLADDRPIMFELADQVVPVYREFRHDLILTDAVRGMNVGSFLHRILSAEAVQLDVEAPRLLHVANSRWRSLNGPLFEKLLGSLRRVHTEEQIDYIRIFRRMGTASTISYGQSIHWRVHAPSWPCGAPQAYGL